MGVERPDWLPVGWKVSVKIRSCGRKDKYYINPSNGLKFNSKLEVLRYLKSSEKDQKPKELNKIEIKKTAAEKLPPGWIKEIRTKKKSGKTRRDPYYIDPVSGRHFRSMQEVFRYLESKDSEKAESSAEAKGQRLIDKIAHKTLTGHETVKSGPILASRLRSSASNNVNIPESNHLDQREDDDSLAIELSDRLLLVNTEKKQADNMPEINILADDKVDKSANGDKRLRSGRNVAALRTVDKPEVNVVEQREREDDSLARNLPNKPPQVNGEEQHKVESRRSMRLADDKLKDNVTKDQSLQSGSEGVAEKNINMPVTNDLEQKQEENNSVGEVRQHENVAYQRKRKKSNSKWIGDLPRRTSKRLACVEVDPSLEVKTDEKTGADARPSDVAEADTTKNLSKAGKLGDLEIDTTGKSDRLKDSNEHPSKSRTEYPNINNPLKKPVTQENLSSIEDHEKKHEQNLDSSLEGLLLDPCIEFAIKTLTGAIPIEDVYKLGDSPVSSLASPSQTSASPSKLPSGDIWADPCFEFAVKTLTGETPKEDGLTLPKFRLDNVSPLNYSISQFDCDVKKTYVRQQGVKDPPFPRAVNGSSQNFVGTSIHHGVERRRGNIKFM